MSNRSGGFVIGFILGALSGAAAALLFAPSSGDEFREQLKEKGIELEQRAADLSGDPEAIHGFAARGRGFVEEQRGRIKVAIQEGKEAAARRKEELLQQIENPDSAEEGDDSIEVAEIEL